MRQKLVALLLLHPLAGLADGFVVDKVYTPYVQLLETEIEYRALAIHDNSDELDNTIIHKLGIGRAIADHWAAEFYITRYEDKNSSLTIDAYEIEAKWQLTEQGEFDSDFGLIFELEHTQDTPAWEAASTLVVTRAIGRWVNTANLSLVYEWGNHIEDEVETAISLQGRYRHSAALEPALEFYAGQDTRGIGPVLAGTQRLGSQNQIHWELGTIFGLGSTSPEVSVRLLLEYEFY